MSVMTYNIRGYLPCDSFRTPSHHWYYRKDYIFNIIQNELPDVLGLQEIFNVAKELRGKCKGTPYKMGYKFDLLISKDITELAREKIYINPKKHLMRDFIRSKLKNIGYKYFYKAGGSPKIIFYKKNKFSFVDGGVFYHNKKKSTTYLFLKNKVTNKIILFLNTHLISGTKHIKTREKSIKFIMNKIKMINSQNYPVILMGDFNIKLRSKEYSSLISNLKILGLKNTSLNKQNSYTYNGFGKTKKTLDYIFSTTSQDNIESVINKSVYSLDKKKMISYATNKKNILFPSDHWGLKAIFKMEN